jgi:hypothetical protein
MDSMQFLHANRIFNILFEDDLTFVQVRAILDHLLERNAFDEEVQAREPFYSIDVENLPFDVWVSDMDVVIQIHGTADTENRTFSAAEDEEFL